MEYSGQFFPENLVDKATLARFLDSCNHSENTQRNLDSDKEYQSQRRDSLAVRLRTGDRAAAAELVEEPLHEDQMHRQSGKL